MSLFKNNSRDNEISINSNKLKIIVLLLLAFGANHLSAQDKWSNERFSGQLKGMSFDYEIEYRLDCTQGTPFVRATLHSVQVTRYDKYSTSNNSLEGFQFPIQVSDGFLELEAEILISHRVTNGGERTLQLNKGYLSLSNGGGGAAITADEFRFKDQSELKNLLKVSGCTDLISELPRIVEMLDITSSEIPKHGGDFRHKGQSLNHLLAAAVNKQNPSSSTSSSSNGNSSQPREKSYQEKEKEKADLLMQEIEMKQRNHENNKPKTSYYPNKVDPNVQALDNMEQGVKKVVNNFLNERANRIREESRLEQEQIEREAAEEERKERQDELDRKRREEIHESRLELAKPYEAANKRVETFLKENAFNYIEINNQKKVTGDRITVFGIIYTGLGVNYTRYDREFRIQELPGSVYQLIGPISIPASDTPIRDQQQLREQFGKILGDQHSVYIHAIDERRDILKEFEELCDYENFDNNIRLSYKDFSVSSFMEEYNEYVLKQDKLESKNTSEFQDKIEFLSTLKEGKLYFFNNNKLTSSPDEVSLFTFYGDKYLIFTIPNPNKIHLLNTNNTSSNFRPSSNIADETSVLIRHKKVDHYYKKSAHYDNLALKYNETILWSGKQYTSFEYEVMYYPWKNTLIGDFKPQQDFDSDVYTPYVEYGSFNKGYNFDLVDEQTKEKLISLGYSDSKTEDNSLKLSHNHIRYIYGLFIYHKNNYTVTGTNTAKFYKNGTQYSREYLVCQPNSINRGYGLKNFTHPEYKRNPKGNIDFIEGIGEEVPTKIYFQENVIEAYQKLQTGYFLGEGDDIIYNLIVQLSKDITTKPEEVKTFHDNGQLKSIGINDPFGKRTGEWKDYHNNGQLKRIGNWQDGKGEGLFKHYHENGQLSSIGEYKSANRSGEWNDYHNNGQLKRIGNWQDGKGEGLFKHYHENGQLSKIGEYTSDKRSGEWKDYHDNGQLKRIGNWQDGNSEGLFKHYHENGQLSAIGEYQKGKRSGAWKDYHDNGQLKRIGNWQDGGEGLFKHYHENGQLSSVGVYQGGEKFGEWKDYHDNGQLKEIGNYQDGEGSGLSKGYYENGQLSRVGVLDKNAARGEWSFYYENGGLQSEVNFGTESHSATVWTDYYENGQLKQITKYDSGLAEWKMYHKNGSIKLIAFCEGGKLMNIVTSKDNKGNDLDKGTLSNGNGTVKLYDENNILEKTLTYIDGVKQKAEE